MQEEKEKIDIPENAFRELKEGGRICPRDETRKRIPGSDALFGVGGFADGDYIQRGSCIFGIESGTSV